MISADPHYPAALAQLELNRLAARVTVACLDLHRELGPGAPSDAGLIPARSSAPSGSRSRGSAAATAWSVPW